MAHDLVELRKIFTSALASDCLDKLGYGRQVLNEDILMISGSGIMLGYAFPVRLESVDAFPEVPYIGLLKALDAVGKDQVYVTPTNRTGRAALWGELLATACAFKGVAGALTDGPTRDLSRTELAGEQGRRCAADFQPTEDAGADQERRLRTLPSYFVAWSRKSTSGSGYS